MSDIPRDPEASFNLDEQWFAWQLSPDYRERLTAKVNRIGQFFHDLEMDALIEGKTYDRPIELLDPIDPNTLPKSE